MDKLIPIQSIYCSKEDETKLCNLDTEVLYSPATHLIHPMLKLWLVNEGGGTYRNKRNILSDKKEFHTQSHMDSLES